MELQPTLTFATGADRVQVTLLTRAWPGSRWTFDDDWLLAELDVASAERRFQAECFLRAPDLLHFRDELLDLAGGRRARAALDPADPWVWAEVVREAEGGLRLRVRARDGHTERVVEFAGELAPPALASLRAEAERAAAAFPPAARQAT
ncbi:MAG: hypothetical protein IT458_14650 [Planctomycetes bacterium]|nr:hypothetical protein [Planctomycetota bacterium]